MAVNRLIVILAIVAFVAPAISFATEFIVGDNDGWKLGVNYEDWAKGKQFLVGDSLVFKYKSEAHNVYKVTGPDFQNCKVQTNNSLGSFSGNDTIKLATAGPKWYICGKNGHCDGGMKLKITVLDSAPAPAPNAASTLFAKATNSQIFLGMISAIAAVVMVN